MASATTIAEEAKLRSQLLDELGGRRSDIHLDSPSLSSHILTQFKVFIRNISSDEQVANDLYQSLQEGRGNLVSELSDQDALTGLTLFASDVISLSAIYVKDQLPVDNLSADIAELCGHARSLFSDVEARSIVATGDSSVLMCPAAESFISRQPEAKRGLLESGVNNLLDAGLGAAKESCLLRSHKELDRGVTYHQVRKDMLPAPEISSGTPRIPTLNTPAPG